MKRSFPFLLLLTLCAGCAKTEFEYAVVCDFPFSYYAQSWLVVSNDKGDILQRFELGGLQTQVNQRFNFQAKDAEDSYNLHLVELDTNTSKIGRRAQVQSYYGVKNGAGVVFQPENLYFYAGSASYVAFHLYIANVPAMDAWNIPGLYVFQNDTSIIHYDPSTQLLDVAATISSQEGMVVRIRPTPAAPFHSIYLLAADLMTDSITIDWTDLMPETNWQSIALANSNRVSRFLVNAVDANLQHSVFLGGGGFLGWGGDDITPQFNLPAGLDPNSLLRINTLQGTPDDYYEREKIFRPGEALKVEAAGMDITNATVSVQGAIDVQTEGPIDLLKVEFFIGDQSRYGGWKIQGEPMALEHATLPDLSSFVPSWFSMSALHPPVQVTAYQYDHLNYSQLREGLPYKGNDGKWLGNPQYDLKKIFKTF